MQKEMKVFLCLLVMLVVMCVIAVPFVFPWLALAATSWFSTPNLIEEKGEFPYKLVYCVEGEEITLEDTLVIEFEDYEHNPGVGENYDWNQYLKSDPETEFDGSFLLHQGEDYRIELCLSAPEWYMGVDHQVEPEAFYVIGAEETRTVGEERLQILYGIEILEMTLPEPLKR